MTPWTVEGVGATPPRPVRVRIDPADVRLSRRVADRRAASRRMDGSENAWTRGCLGAAADPIFVGYVGEFGFARWCNDTLGVSLTPDLRERSGGDGGVDFRVPDAGGLTVQVKTAVTDYDELLIRSEHVTVAGWDYIVRCHYRSPRVRVSRGGLFGADVAFDPTEVELCGYVRRWDILRSGLMPVPARNGRTWFNYEIPSHFFRPMGEFAAVIQTRQLLGGQA